MKQVFEIKKENVQGLVARGYGHLKHAAFVLLIIEDPARAKRWLEARLPEIIVASDEKLDTSCLNLAFTYRGLQKMKLDSQDLCRFPAAFQQGMVTDHRSRILGDDDTSLQAWRWGTRDRVPDLLLLLYASTEAQLEERLGKILMHGHGLIELQTLETVWTDKREHFGFADGISQPTIKGLENQDLHQLARTGQATALNPGEFLLGYTNEFGTITEEENVFGQNGTYLVFRQMEQHVDEFWGYFMEKGGNTEEAKRLAAKVVGRWQGGAPLALSPTRDEPSLRSANDFGFAEDDPHGYRCPIGAHIRRANPRDSLAKDPIAALTRTNRRRLLRRGRAYGPNKNQERGLHFICLCGDLERQFEFVQQSWINNPSFGDLAGEADPLTATRLEVMSGRFTIPKNPVRQRLVGMPQFVSVRGGAYFFMPGIPALRKLARATSPQTCSSD